MYACGMGMCLYGQLKIIDGDIESVKRNSQRDSIQLDVGGDKTKILIIYLDLLTVGLVWVEVRNREVPL